MKGQYKMTKAQNPCLADAAGSGIRVVLPDASRATPHPHLQTRYVQTLSKLCSRKLAIDFLGRDHVHVRRSTTQPSRLQKFVRAVGEISVGSRPTQSTRVGSCEPLNLGTIRVNSSRIALQVA